MSGKIRFLSFFVGLTFAVSGVSFAQQIPVDGGVLTLYLDPIALGSAGLSLSSVSDEVTTPGALGSNSFDFDLNGRNHLTRPTTFAYEQTNFEPFSGTGEAIGSLFFNSGTPNAVEFGDFTIAYSAGRVVPGSNSGFYLQSNTGSSPLIVFDLSEFGNVNADTNLLTADAPALVSPELAIALGNSQFTGAVAGSVAFNFSAVAVAPLLGDVNIDGFVDFLDISPFIAVLSSGGNQAEADCDESGAVDFLDISPFISILSGS